MSACNVEVVKLLGKYLNTPVGTVAFNTDKVLTTVIDKQSIEGFASIVLQLAVRSGISLSQVEYLKIYQWLELLSLYGNQAAGNATFAKQLLEDFNRALQRSTYLTGHSLSVADVAAYYVLYPSLERLSVSEKESLINVCRWSKHIQAQPKVCSNRPPLPLNTLTLSILAPAVAH